MLKHFLSLYEYMNKVNNQNVPFFYNDILQIDLCIHAYILNTYYPYYISNILEDKKKLKIVITKIQKIKMQLVKFRLLL